MALVWEREAMMEDGVYRFIYDVRYDDATGEINRVRIYPQPSRERLIIRQTGVADRVVSIPPSDPAIGPAVPFQPSGGQAWNNVTGSMLVTNGLSPYRYSPDGGDGFVSIEQREDTNRQA